MSNLSNYRKFYKDSKPFFNRNFATTNFAGNARIRLENSYNSRARLIISWTWTKALKSQNLFLEYSIEERVGGSWANNKGLWTIERWYL